MNTLNKQIQSTDRKQGFTIIEVVLVLAIAGLIFLMVFLALPALQKGQRDTQRQQDLSRISTQITSFSSNARGQVPKSGTLGSFVQNYLGEGATTAQAGAEYSDPSGVVSTDEGISADLGYVIRYNSGAIGSETGTVYYTDGYICDDSGTGGVTPAKARNYALRINLENQETPYCIDNR